MGTHYPRRVVILGSTGSIGRQTLDVIRSHPDRFQVVGLAANRNADELLAQAHEFRFAKLALFDQSAAAAAHLPGGIEALSDLAVMEEADIVVVSVAGVIGLVPTLAAIKAGKHVALASKEVLVAAGEVVMPLLRQAGTLMTPIDSEHSAVFQCLQGAHLDDIDEVILTASGGPFRGWTSPQLAEVTVAQALNHPTWAMGGKITIDSATLMNKGLELIEAKWLFGVEPSQVKMVVHPQSIIHSMLKFKDGSVLGQMGWPNMRLPIQYALTYPERPASGLRNWDPIESPSITFEPIYDATFPCPALARHSIEIGQTMPCAMNAANEEAANAFLQGRIGFMDIPKTVDSVMNRHSVSDVSLESLLNTDAWARAIANELMSPA